MNIPIFVINLPVNTERRQAVEAQLRALGAQYEIVEGVYGNDERVTNRYNEEMAIIEHGKPLTQGEKGCALAHALIYERIVREAIPYALILEDDILLPKNFLSILADEIQKSNKKWDWLSFDYRYAGVRFLRQWFVSVLLTIQKKPGHFFYACLKAPYIILLSLYEELRERLVKSSIIKAGAKPFYRPLYNAGAYIISGEGAQKLLPFTKPLRMGADTVPNKARFKTSFSLYGYVPLVVSQNTSYKSMTLLSDVEWKKINGTD